MSIEALLHVENDLRQQNAVVDKRVASIHGRMAKLRTSQFKLEAKYKKVGTAKNWETRQKEAKVRELERAKAELEAKRMQIKLLSEKGEELRNDIKEIEDKMTSLNREGRTLEREYEHPSLKSIVMYEAERMGPIEQQIVNKTVESLFPPLRLGLQEVEAIHYKLEHTSRIISLFTSLCVYVLGISLLCVTYRCVKNVHRVLTLPKLLVTVDMAFVAVWVLVVLCYGIIQWDPLWVMAYKHATLSVCIQITMMASLIGNVLLRCLMVSVKFSKSSMFELFWVVLVTQHYYQAVWVPFLLDKQFKTTHVTYFGYFVVHAGLAVYRARTIGRPGEMSVKECEHDGGKLKERGQWIRRKVESTLQYCEDLLTTGLRQSQSRVDLNDGDEGGGAEGRYSRRMGVGVSDRGLCYLVTGRQVPGKVGTLV